MNSATKCLFAGVGAILISGCVVREEPPHRHYYVVEEGPPPVVEDPGPGYVEVVPAAPGPEYVWSPGVYVWVNGHRMWRHGYYHRR